MARLGIRVFKAITLLLTLSFSLGQNSKIKEKKRKLRRKNEKGKQVAYLKYKIVNPANDFKITSIALPSLPEGLA